MGISDATSGSSNNERPRLKRCFVAVRCLYLVESLVRKTIVVAVAVAALISPFLFCSHIIIIYPSIYIETRIRLLVQILHFFAAATAIINNHAHL
jgi:hypothetical protein